MLTAKERLSGTAVAIVILALAAPRVPSQVPAREDLSPCPGSAAEPSQTGAWSVAFCNRTGHDLVLEFHDNDCPANEWSRRGDVYQRTLRREESKTFPLCYASEPPGRKPAPGLPMLRIPGGKGVVTTWSVVGDCGDRSKPLSLDARTFYDRGEYKTGIILLQYPAGAPHCNSDASSAAGALSSSAPAPASTSAAVAATTPAAIPPPPAARAPAPASAPSPVSNRGNGVPTLSAAVDTKDVISRTVHVFAKEGAGYKCNFNLALTFTDGGTWNDHGSIGITAGDADSPIATRKYLKSVSKVQVTSSKCAPM